MNDEMRKKIGRKARPKAKKRRIVTARPVLESREEEEVLDLEDLLINSMVKSKQKIITTPIEPILYNLTPAVSSLGYKYGFSIGKNLFSKAKGNKNMLLDFLEKMDFGKVTYQPFSDKLLITSTGTKHTPLGLEKNLHVYEAGIIAGYLSTAAGLKLNAHEAHCVYHNTNFCQFVCSPLQNSGADENVRSENIVRALVHFFKTYAVANNAGADYSILKILPLLREPLLGEEAKLMNLVGARLAAESRSVDYEKILGSIASAFGITLAGTSLEKNNRRIIKLRYGHYNSIDGFLKLSVQPFVGFATKLFHAHASLYKSTNKNNTYTITIELDRIRKEM